MSALHVAVISKSEFFELIGDANLLAILAAAKTNPQVELIFEKMKQRGEVDLDSIMRGSPIAQLKKLKNLNIISAIEYRRIMRREYP